MKLLAMLAAWMALPVLALADPGSVASSVDPFYTAVAQGRVTYLLCDGISDANNETSCQPSKVLEIPAGSRCYETIFSISKCQTGCEPGTIDIMESDSMTVGAPNLWSRVGQLTGCLAPLVSSFPINRMPKAALRAQLSAITDPQCTEVDVTVTFFCF